MKTWRILKDLGIGAALLATLAMGHAGAAQASAIGGVFSTDRLGYTGEVVRYATQADAQAAVNPLETIAIGDDVNGDDSREHRDGSVTIVDNAPAYDTDYNYVTSPWWYTTKR